MKKTLDLEAHSEAEDDLLPEYDFDYSKAKPNRFAALIAGDRVVVTLDPDVSAVFTNPEAVNSVLRALITTMPQTPRRKGMKKTNSTR